LRLAINIFIEAYKQKNPNTTARLVDGNIQVKTQFKHLLDTKNTTRDQDIKMTTTRDITYVEFHNRANTNPPVEIRSVEYFGLGIGHSRGKPANQIWLLAEDVESTLRGKTFARYILTDEDDNIMHPGNSGIMYVSLTQLSKEISPAGELASFLLGKEINPQNEDVKKIVNAFNTSFKGFKSDKEVAGLLSLAERYTNDGRIEGLEEGLKEGFVKAAIKLLEKGKSVKDY